LPQEQAKRAKRKKRLLEMTVSVVVKIKIIVEAAKCSAGKTGG
jgi:hypothetical protein